MLLHKQWQLKTDLAKDDIVNKNTSLITAIILAALLAVGTVWRMYMQETAFSAEVREALKTSEGYDQKFINMVNNLEDELATRASFGYIGERDPMTGKKRKVILPQRRKGRIRVSPKEEVDPFRLTAIIFDETERKFTAIVMDGERSYSIETGDIIAKRRINAINDNAVIMESEEYLYWYDVTGAKKRKKKN